MLTCHRVRRRSRDQEDEATVHHASSLADRRSMKHMRTRSARDKRGRAGHGRQKATSADAAVLHARRGCSHGTAAGCQDPPGGRAHAGLGPQALTDKLIQTMIMVLTPLIGFATLGHGCYDAVRSFAALAKESADDEDNDLLLATSLVEACLPVESYFLKRPQLSSNVMARARVLDAHRRCWRTLDGHVRPGGAPWRARRHGERRYLRPGDRASRR